MRKLKFSLAFASLVFLHSSIIQAQPADSRPVLKYLINNYSIVSDAVCPTCEQVVGKPLSQFRPIPFPPTAIVNAIPGFNIDQVPGIAAPNFLGGGSPEIKGLVNKVAGMTETYAKRVRTEDKLYFRSGATGIAVSKSGRIFTSSSTILPGVEFDFRKAVNGFFSFKSAPARLPVFNSTSEQEFEQSPTKLSSGNYEIFNEEIEVAYFAVDPNNEKIMYAVLNHPLSENIVRLARKGADGKWAVLTPPGGVWGAMAVDYDGNLYIADARKHIIVKAEFDDAGKAKSWQTIAGKSGTSGFENDEDGEDARFNKPSGICVDKNGNIFVADAGNNVIRKIDDDGQVTTYAGNEDGEAGYNDDDDWEDAKFNMPTAVAYNETTETLYVVDANNKVIREINDDREVSTLAGNAGLANPVADPQSFANSFYFVLAKLNMDPDEAKFSNPTAIAIDPSGFGLYVCDGNYIKYVNTSETVFLITSAIGDPKANALGLPLLPPGIVMNPNNGSFFGVPLVPWKPTIYSISVTNHVGTSLLNGFIRFEVISCKEKPEPVIDSKIISYNQLPYTWNGRVVKSAGTDTIMLRSSLGCDSLVVLNLMVKPDFSYSPEPYILSLGQQIKPIVPTSPGSKVDTYSINPALPNSLAFNAQTGEISGTPLTTGASQPYPVIGPKTAVQYPAPWTLNKREGADITQVQISDANQKAIFENNSSYQSLNGSAGQGIGTAGAYTDFSSLGAIKMVTNTPYSMRLSNTLSGGNSPYSLNQTFSAFQYMNSYAVYIDYNRDGDFADAGERVYISVAPQRDAHTEAFNLKLPVTAMRGVTKMRIYCVEAPTSPRNYFFWDRVNPVVTVTRTTSRALSFYPFLDSISNFANAGDFYGSLDYGEFEDYNIDIVNLVSQSYVITGSNSVGSAQSSIRIAVTKPTTSSTEVTICSTELPYTWNGLTFSQAGTQTAHLVNVYGADSAATLNLKVKQATSSVVAVSYCGPYTYEGKVYNQSGDYTVHVTNAVGCDSAIIFRFRQKATASVTNLEIIPGQLPYTWNDVTFSASGSQTVKLTNAEKCDSIATLNLKVLYNIYYPTNNVLEVNKTISPLKPQIEGNYPLGTYYAYYGFNISPALPNGLTIDPISGIISGTPTQLSALRTYTVTLQQYGAKPTTFNLSVGVPTTSTTSISNCGPYTWNGIVYDKPTTVLAKFVNQYGFDSTATLVLAIRNPSASTTHLFLNQSQLPYDWNGVSITKEGTKTINLVNAVGCDSAVTVNVVVAPKVSYQSPNILLANQPVVPLPPQNTGGVIETVLGNVTTYFKTNFLVPISVAVDAQDNSFISNEQDGLIYKTTKEGIVSTLNSFGTTRSLLATDNSGNLYAADRISNRIIKRDNAGNITVLADASLPNGIATDGAGNVYFSEGRYHRIRKISSTGNVSTLAGGTTVGFADGNGIAAKFNTPSGLCLDKAGNVYVADLLNNRIRKITPAGDVTTFAGNDNATSLDGIKGNAGFNAPIDIATDSQGNKYVVDNGSSKIRKIDTAGMVSTLAGTTVGYQDGAGSQAKFSLPMGLTTDSHGQVYVADKANSAIRQINAINYTIHPALVKGLRFDEATGVISGVPTDTLLQPVTYTIHAFNNAGADSIKIILAVCNPMATSFKVDTCNQYVWNDSTYTTSTTHTRVLKNKGGCDSTVTMHLVIRKGSTGPTTTVTACGTYVWEGLTYDKTGLYTRVYPNAVGCDSTLNLNLTIKLLSYNTLFVDINKSQFPYTLRGKTFAVPGTDTLMLRNSVGCDSILSLTVRISNLLPDISYAITDTTLYWDKSIEVPITMTNTGSPIPETKIAERDTLVKFSPMAVNGLIRHLAKGPDGNYYATKENSNQIFTLSKAGVWSVYAGTVDEGTSDGPKATAKFGLPQGLGFDAAGNLFVANYMNGTLRKITPAGVVSTINTSPRILGTDPNSTYAYMYAPNALVVDADNNVIVQSQRRITKFNLSTNQFSKMDLDYTPYFNGGEADMKVDTKGNIYILSASGSNVVKIKPNGQMSSIGQPYSDYDVFKPGNGSDAFLPWVSRLAVDPSNDNLYLMAFGQLLRVDTSENVSAVTGRWFTQNNDQIIKVDSGQVEILNNSGGALYNAHAYGVGSIPFMDNYGGGGLSSNYGIPRFTDFDKRIRLDSSGTIVGTPRGEYNPQTGTVYAANTFKAYSIVGANHYGTSSHPMVITTKSITYINETFVTTSFPFTWRGRSFNAATDTATYLAKNKTMANDTLYTLFLLHEVPEPAITATGNCVAGNITLAANTAGKNAIGFDGVNVAVIKYSKIGRTVPYYNSNYYPKPNNVSGFNPTSAYEFWIKPVSVSGTQYLFTKDTVQSHGGFIGLSIQNEKLVYEFTKGYTTPVAYKVTSNSKIIANAWTHVAAAYYDSALHIIINGQLDGFYQTPNYDFNNTYNDPANTTTFYPDFFVGGLGHQYGFKGEMDELRVWNTKRDANTTSDTRSVIVNPSDAGLALYYRFDGAVSDNITDLTLLHRPAILIKPATSVSPSMAPINFASYNWMPGGATTKSIVASQPGNTLYTLTVADYKATPGSGSLLVSTGPSNSIETIRICGSSYNWHGTTYTASTSTPTWTGKNRFGCDSIVTLHLTLDAPPVPVITGASNICVGGTAALSATGFTSYVWLPNGETSAGITVQPKITSTYTLKVTDANGCQGSASKTIVVSGSTSFTEKISACESYTWHGQTFTSSNNTATWLGVNAAGCDSLVTLDLRINPLPAPTIVSANGQVNCFGNPLQITARASGNQLLLDGNSRVVEDAMGVDPSKGFTLEGWVNFSGIGTVQSIISQTSGNTPLPFDAWLNANGTVSFAVGNGVGTSSITTATNITAKSWHHVAFVYSNKTMAIYIDGVSSASGVAILPVAGKLNNFMIGNNQSLSKPMVGAVDEIRIWNVALSKAQIAGNINASVKAGSDGLVAYYKFDETDDQLPVNSVNGAMTATIVGNATHSLSSSPIVYQSYTWTGGLTTPIITVNDPATLYNVRVTDVNGCIAAVTGNVVVSTPSTFTEVVKACGSYNWHGVNFTSSNNKATWVTQNAAGCDSVVTLKLSIGKPSATIETAVACNYFTWHGNTYETSTSTATWVTVNAAGCDSVVTLHLIINSTIEHTETVTTCGSYTWHDSTYTASTDAPVWFGKSKSGCDSIVHLNLTIADFPVVKINATKRLTDVCLGGLVLRNANEAFTKFATGVNSFSSELTQNVNQQILGAPNTYPNYGSIATAWSTNDDNLRREFIELTYDNPQPINFIDIYETFNSGTIDTVYVKNPATNAFEVVYVGTAELYNTPLRNRISFPMTAYAVSTIRIAINSVDVPVQKSIDAVGIGVVNTDTYKWSDGSTRETLAVTKPGVYILTTTNASGCSISDKIELGVIELQSTSEDPVVTPPAEVTRTNSPASCTVFITDVELSTATASDNCPGVTVQRTGVPAGNLFPVGVTIITYTATNAAGRTATVTQTITVTDNQKPIITSNGNKAVNNDNNVCGAAVTVNANATDNCSVGIPKGVRSDGLSLSAVYPVGITTITWNVADAYGNAALPVTQTVTVTDKQIPIITSNGNLVVNNDKDVCGAVVKASANATDNCAVGIPIGVRSDGLALSAVYPVGITTVTWNVADIKGNAALPVIQTVTVIDNQKPTVLTKNISVTLVNGTASITAAQIDAGSKDNCGIKTISVSPSTFRCGEYGDNTVTLTVVDINGNVGTKTAIVNVKGAPLPSIVVSRTDNTFTGLDGKTIALGYGTQQLTLTASNTGSPVNATTYRWSPATGLSSTNTANTVFKPTAAGTFVFTVSATNEYGCTGTTTVTINVVDVRCGNSGDKVLVCHKTGSISNPTTQVCISKNAVATHLSNGSMLGMCPQTYTSTYQETATPITSATGETKSGEKELIVLATPNPTTNVFRLRISSNDQNTPATVRVLDAHGRSLNQFDNVAIGSTLIFGEGYLNGFYFAEVLQGTQRKVVKLIKGK